jgi:arylsulfatase A-like enzyme
MEGHRPYGRGEEGVSKSLDRKSVFKPEQLTETEQSEIEEKYTRSLRRVGDRVAQLRERLDGDHTFVFTADHGESFGEAGFYFHPGQRRCVHDVLIDVPVVVDGLSFESDHVSILDIAPTLTSSVGVEPPDEWNGFDVRTYDRDSAVTVAPWHSKATVCWQDFERKLVAADADVSFETSRGTGHTSREEVPPELEQRLNDLGYVDAG